MPVQLDRTFLRKQRLYVRRVLQGYPMYFGLQVTSAKAGKLLLSTRRSDVTAKQIRELQPYQGRGAERNNQLSATPRMGVATAAERIMILHFRRGKVQPVSARFVMHFVKRDLRYPLLRRVVTAAADELPVVPEHLDAARLLSAEPVRERAIELARRMQDVSGDTERLGETIAEAVKLASVRLDDADEMLDDVDYILSALERADRLEQRLHEIAARPNISAEAVERISQRYLQMARFQIESGTLDMAVSNLDVADELMDRLDHTT